MPKRIIPLKIKFKKFVNRQLNHFVRKKHTRKVKVWMIFEDWLDKNHQSVGVNNNEEYFNLRMGSFHESGAFLCEMKLVSSDLEDLKKYLECGYKPMFYLDDLKRNKKKQ